MKVVKIIKILRKRYPKRFQFGDPFRVLISTILSQRTKDENTRKASKDLFSKFKNARQISKSNEKEIRKLIKPAGFYQQKAKNIRGLSKILVEKYEGKVPKSMEELLALPGVGEKTASCVLLYGYKIDRIPVDIHVFRISNRIGIVKTKNPEETEKQLMEVIPKIYWKDVNELFVQFGKEICKSKPKCEICPIKRYCNFYLKKGDKSSVAISPSFGK